MTPEPGAEVLLLSGTVGAGKTTTAYAIGELLAAAGTPHAVIDLDEIRRMWPAPQDDPFHTALELENLRALAATYRRAGAQRLVLAGVVEGPGAREGYQDAVGGAVLVCRLRVDLAEVRRRLHGRHEEGAERDWHLERSGELDAILEAEAAADLTVDVAGQSPGEVARRVLDLVGWVRS